MIKFFIKYVIIFSVMTIFDENLILETINMIKLHNFDIQQAAALPLLPCIILSFPFTHDPHFSKNVFSIIFPELFTMSPKPLSFINT